MRVTLRTWRTAIHVGPLVCSLALSGATAADAAERAPVSMSFVEREAATTDGWTSSSGNPLRSGALPSLSSNQVNSLRAGSASRQPGEGESAPREDEQVTPTAYQGQSRAPRGLELRPHAPKTGIFSSWFGEGEAAKADTPAPKSKPTSKPNPAAAAPATAANSRAQGLMPQMLSGAEQKGYVPKPISTAGARPAAGSDGTQQASYNTAAAARSYQPPGMTGGQSSTSRRPAPSASATRPKNSPALRSRSASTASRGSTPPTPIATPNHARPARPTADTAQALTAAHRFASSARTDEDYTRIFLACQQIPAERATAEEAAFGRELASWALNRRGQLRATEGRNKEAIADFDASIRLDPSRWRALHNRGVLMAQAGQFEQAFDDFHQTIELHPRFAKAYSNRAALYVLAGELEPALADYEQAVALDPKLTVAQRGCGRTYHMLGRLEEALDHFEAALAQAPGDATTLTNRGDLLTDLGRYAEARDDYERALKVNGKSAAALRSSAWLLATCPDASIRNPHLALERAQLAARLERQADSVTYDTLAAAQASTGDYRQALVSIRQAIELAPAAEKSAFQDRLTLYRKSTPYRIEPVGGVRQARYTR